MPDIAASVRAKLKNKSKKTGIGYQKCLQLFFQEEFLRRLAASRYAENFVLKGGLFIYTLTNFESRSTVDIDFLMRGLNNDLARMDEIIEEILNVSTGNGFVTFKAQKRNRLPFRESIMESVHRLRDTSKMSGCTLVWILAWAT